MTLAAPSVEIIYSQRMNIMRYWKEIKIVERKLTNVRKDISWVSICTFVFYQHLSLSFYALFRFLA